MRSVFRKVMLGDLDISDYIDRMEFEEDAEGDNVATLRIYNAGADYLLDIDDFATGRKLVITFGFIEGPKSSPRTVLITDMAPSYLYNETQLTVHCADRGVSLRKHRSKRIWKKTNTGKIVKEIADMHGLNTATEEPAGGWKEYDSIPQQDMSNRDFLQYLADRESEGDYQFYVSDDTLHFVTRNTDAKSTSIVDIGAEGSNVTQFDIRWKESTKGANEVSVNEDKVSILGDKGDGNAVIDMNGVAFDVTEAGKKVGEILTNTLDKNIPIITNAKKDANASTDVKTTYPEVMKSVSKAWKNSVMTQGPAFQTGPGGSDEALNLAKSSLKKKKKKVLTASLSEEGNPSRHIFTVITVKGIHKRFIGSWYVHKVSHIVDKNNYMTTSELSKEKFGPTNADSTDENKVLTDTPDDTVSIGLEGANNGVATEKVDGRKKVVHFKTYTPANGAKLGDQ